MAVTYYNLSANQKNNQAQFKLALCYEKGIGVAQDNAQAFNYYKQAAEQGFLPEHQYQLACCYALGKGTELDISQAADYYKLAADSQWHVQAAFEFARCCEEGRGVTKNSEIAVQYYKLAADDWPGHADACRKLATIYQQGADGIAADATQAEHYHKRAEQCTS